MSEKVDLAEKQIQRWRYLPCRPRQPIDTGEDLLHRYDATVSPPPSLVGGRGYPS